MRIGVDATCWTNRRGYGRHLRSLLGATLAIDRANHWVLFTDSDGEFPRGAEIVRVAASSPAVQAASSTGRRSLADLWSMSRALARPGLDCLLFPTVYSYVPVLSRAAKIVVIHDVIPEKFPQHVFPTAAGRWNWTLKSLLARRQARLIVTVSDFSRRQILDYFGERPERVKVVGEAGDPVFRRLDNPPPAEGRLLVFVGGFSPHKNLLGLLDAFAAVIARPGLDDVRLALIGDYQTDSFHSCYHQVRDRVSQLQGRVTLPGYLPDEDLVRLLNTAAALVLPSLMEGFGLPAIEAAACGCPVVATTAGPLPDLLGDGGLYVAPGDSSALAGALDRVLRDTALRSRMAEAGLRAAARLSWDRAARELLAVLDHVSHRHAKAA